MLSCKEVSRLVSEGLERDLSFPERMGVRLHLVMCRACSRFRQQIRFLRRALLAYEKHGEPDRPSSSLSFQARKRIQETLERNES